VEPEYGTGLIAERVREALGGTKTVAPQSVFSVAWVTEALYEIRKGSLNELCSAADSINHGVPTPDEVAWSFLQLRERRWLEVHEDDRFGNEYALTNEGRKAVDEICSGEEMDRPRVSKLEQWFESHPLGADFREKG
jgi:hypothetical protein